ncbi:MAG: phosphatidylglycerophosphatase A [Comamonadaceae bacterium]|nr:phosphatidylglycerophosphatase A [Comamonadaceae bacterium]
MSLADAPRDDVTDVQAHASRPAPQASAAPEPIRLEPLSTSPVPRPAGAVRPNARFMRGHPAHWIAFGFGSGLSPIAPGTAGTLWGWLAWLVLSQWLTTPAEQGLVIIAGLAAAWWASTVTARNLRIADPSAIVVDEIIAFWIVLWLVLPAGLWTQLVAFILFRFFDAVKRGPVGWADRLFHGATGWRGGFGIVWDDLVAAFCTLMVMAAWRAW